MINNDYSSEIEDMCSYLENRYNEQFTVAKLISDDGELDAPNKAYVHPKGREAEWFVVRIEENKENGTKEYRDGYGFVFVERSMAMEYQEWLDKIIPSAKMAVRVWSADEITHFKYDSKVSLDELTMTENDSIGMDATIFVCESQLDVKAEYREKANKAFNDIPYKDDICECHLLFINEESFPTFNHQFYKGTGAVEMLFDGGLAVLAMEVNGNDC